MLTSLPCALDPGLPFLTLALDIFCSFASPFAQALSLLLAPLPSCLCLPMVMFLAAFFSNWVWTKDKSYSASRQHPDLSEQRWSQFLGTPRKGGLGEVGVDPIKAKGSGAA